MIQRPHSTLFSIQQLVASLTRIERHHRMLGHDRHENDIEHSFTVAMLCWYTCEHHKLPLDINKVLKYALIHDFTELYTGDVHAYASAKDRQSKSEQEEKAIERMANDYPDFPGMITVMRDYQAKIDDESLFVWTLDKLQAFIHSELDDWYPHKAYNIDYDWFVRRHSEQIEQSSPYAKEIFTEILEYAKSTYYDQPAEHKPN